jgi:hypothetical protein
LLSIRKKDGNHSGILASEITYADGKPSSLMPLGGQQNDHRPMHLEGIANVPTDLLHHHKMLISFAAALATPAAFLN